MALGQPIDDVSCDFETKSAENLKASGVTRYAQHPTTDVLMFSFYNPYLDTIQSWLPGDPYNVRDWLEMLVNNQALLFRAWNASFERHIWEEIMVKRHGFPPIALRRWRCTAADAAANSLPRRLEATARVLGVAEQKDDAGHRLMLQVSKPRKPRKGEDPNALLWWDEPAKIQRLLEYNIQDVRTEMAVKRRVRDLPVQEQDVYFLDQEINDRGVVLDVPLARAIQWMANEVQERADHELMCISDRAVGGVTKRNDILRFLKEEGTDTEKLDKDAVRALLASDDLTGAARRVLELRQEAGKSSVKKVNKMFGCVSRDGRMHDLLLYHGAGTGRWAGRLIQPQNLPARSKTLGSDFSVDHWLEPIRQHEYELIDSAHPPLEVLAMGLRPCIRASEGMQFIGADFAAIEARVLAWLAGEKWQLNAYRTGEDIYKLMASVIYRKPPELITKAERQMGKAVVLGCGFGMGWRKFVITLAKDDVVLDDSEAESIIQVYREKNALIKLFWYALERAAVAAVKNPGTRHYVAGGKLCFIMSGDYLRIVLPNRKRTLAYYKPTIVTKTTPWGSQQDAVRFWGENDKRQWVRMDLYGGLLAENVTQAVARDIMVAAMFRLEAAGYKIVLSIHDELLAEVLKTFGSVDEFERLMATLEPWMEGCPVKAEGWSGDFFQK
jgi:DNA polymerase bacteriophage-type